MCCYLLPFGAPGTVSEKTFFSVLFQAENKDVIPPEGSEKSESSKPSLWKDVSLFAKPNEVKKTEMTNEKPLRSTNNTAATKLAPSNTTLPDQTPVKEPPQVLSTEKQKPVGMVTPTVKVTKKCTQEEAQQPSATTVNRTSGEVEHPHTPDENIRNTSPPQEHNQVSSFISTGLYISSLQTRLFEQIKPTTPNVVQTMLHDVGFD
jgi:hypothetical protein